MPIIIFKKTRVTELVSDLLGFDPYWDNVVLLMHMDGADSGTSFIDEKSHTVTAAGNTVTKTATKKYGTASTYFDGSGDYLSTVSASDLQLGSSNFTIEFWVNYTTATPYFHAVSKWNANAMEYMVYINTATGAIGAGGSTDGSTQGIVLTSSNGTVSPNTWYHVAYTRLGSSFSLYVNGVSVATATNSSALFTGSSPLAFGGRADGSYYGTGYLDDVRITKGIARYTSSFTPRASAFPNGAVELDFDPYWPQTVLSVHGPDVVDQTFTNSANAVAVTPVGSTKFTPYSPYANGSVSFNGTSSYLSVPNHTSLDLANGDFTIECWFQQNSYTAGGYQVILSKSYNDNSGQGPFVLQTFGNVLKFFAASTGAAFGQWDLTSGATIGTITMGVWYHVAVVRTGSTITYYLNGTNAGTTNVGSAALYQTTYPLVVGAVQIASGFASYLNGTVADVRIVKGTAVYSSNFSIPTAPLTAVAGTSVLTCQHTSRIVDASSNAATITRTGSPLPSNRTPYWVTPANGSFYLNGSTDYITIPAASGQFLATDFTVELWYLPTSGTVSPGRIINSDNSGSGYSAWEIGQAGGNVFFNAAAQTTSGNVSLGGAVNINSWNHLVFARSGTTFSAFINGVRVGTQTANIALYSGGYMTIGARYVTSGYGEYAPGYVADVRVAGSAAYSASATSITVPTSPVSTIPVNSILLNCANTGVSSNNSTIVDSSVNALSVTRAGDVTQGSQSPFIGSGGSAYFDGTGDYLTVPSSGFDISSLTDWTIEFWIKPTVDAWSYIFQNYTSSGGTLYGQSCYLGNSSDIGFESWNGSSASPQFTMTTNYVKGIWNHIAIVRSGSGTNNIKMFVNGVLGAQGTYTTFYAPGQAVTNIGCRNYTAYSQLYNGYLSNMRVVKGVAVYTGNFTVPTAPLTSDGNTSLLLNFNSAPITDATRQAALYQLGNATYSTSVKKLGASSLYFDGVGDYMQAPTSSNYDFGASDFTIEAWVYQTANTGFRAIAGYANGSASNSNYAWDFQVSGGLLRMDIINGTTQYLATSSVTLALNTWYHVAACRSGNTMTVYVNGVATGSVSVTGVVANNPGGSVLQVGRLQGGYDFAGYIDDLRITKGKARYTANFTPKMRSATADVGTTVYDPYWEKVVLRMPMDSTNGNTLFTDICGHSVTSYGNTNSSTATYKFGTSSTFFDGNNDWISVANHSDFDFGAGEFTIEMWVYPTSVQTEAGYITKRATINDTTPFQVGTQSVNGQNRLFIVAYTNSWVNGASWSKGSIDIPVNTWTHIAVERRGDLYLGYVNGKLDVSFTMTGAVMTNTQPVTIGAAAGSGQFSFNGYIDDIRITKGVARYSNNFNVPTAALPTSDYTWVSGDKYDPYWNNTVLQMPMDSLTDNKGHSITANGNAAIVTSQKKFGTGSCYFDGTSGNYISIANTSEFDLGNSDFTIEFWFNASSTSPAYQTLISKSTNDVGATGPFNIQLHNDKVQFLMDANDSTASWDMFDYTSTSPITVGSWNHVAMTRNGSSVNCFVNGVNVYSYNAGTTSVKQTSYPILIGAVQYSGGIINNYNGYIDDVRITKGKARYTQNFTVPAEANPTFGAAS